MKEEKKVNKFVQEQRKELMATMSLLFIRTPEEISVKIDKIIVDCIKFGADFIRK